jgi:hypothetical protein
MVIIETCGRQRKAWGSKDAGPIFPARQKAGKRRYDAEDEGQEGIVDDPSAAWHLPE